MSKFAAALVLGASLLTQAAPSPHRSHGGAHRGNYTAPQAAYFLNVEPSGSSVIAIQVGSDRLLENRTTITSTQGAGLQAINASIPSKPPVSFDVLQSQQAVSVGDEYLFTVNSGSDTAVMFRINPADPLALQLVGEPIPTLGSYPSSITYSTKLKKACVLNSGSKNGVTCFHVDSHKGLVPDGVGLRAFNFSFPTPPHLFGAKGSGSDIQFTGDSSRLLVTAKGDIRPERTGAHFVSMDVDPTGNIATRWTQQRFDSLTSVFGFALKNPNGSSLFATQALFGGAVLNWNAQTNNLTIVQLVNNTAFGLSCWATYSEVTDKFYNFNAVSANIGVINSETGALEQIFDFAPELRGGLDAVVAGTTGYFMAQSNAIVAFDLISGATKQIYTYGLESQRLFWQGLALWPANPLLYGGV